VSRTDKLIDLAGLGLTAFIIFTLVKSFKGLADWLGGAGETIKKSVIEPIQKGIETTVETTKEIGSGIQKEVTKPVPVYPIASKSKAEEFGMTVAKFVTQPPPLAFATTVTEQVLKRIIKPKKVTSKPKPKPVDIRKLHKEHPAITKSVPSKSFTDYVQKVKSKPKELRVPGIERIIAKLP